MGKLVFDSKQDGEYTVMTIGGTIDTGVAPELEQKMGALIKDGSKVIGDLSSLEHLTSAGIGVLVDAKNKLDQAGGDLRLCGASDKIMKVLKMMNLPNIVPVLASVDAAKQDF